MSSTSTGSATVHVDAPAELIYDMVTDVARMGEWSPECVGADVPAGSPVAAGFTFTGRNARGEAEWTSPCQVVAADRPTLFSFTAGEPGAATTWTFELRSADGATEITESFDSEPLRDPARAEQLAGRHGQLLEDLSSTLAGVKSVAERERVG
jgi:uncharacterized protein YndB with AHSA1/START domain